MQAAGSKRKFKIDDYLSSERANPIIQNISQTNQVLSCICGSTSEEGQTCFKCKTFVHQCLAAKSNRAAVYECASCLNKSMDPLFHIEKVLNESYFRTQSIFQYSNLVNFEFNLKHEDKDLIVELRCLHSGSTSLGWPMQGGFSINDEKMNFHEMKPLLINSNRKARREEYFTIPNDKLRVGKNFLRFKIPCLDKNKFTHNFQFEEKKEYFFALNLIKKYTAK